MISAFQTPPIRGYRARRLALRLLALALVPFLSTSCGWLKPPPPARAKPVLFDWQDDRGPGAIAVRINLRSQLATFQRGGRYIGWSYVSTGKEGHATAAGSYKVMEKLELKHSNRYGWIADAFGRVTNGDAQPTTPVPPGEFYHPAPMHWWMRLTRYGVGMHAGEIPKPGEAASHGCIRLPRDFAPILYQEVIVGTPVTLVR